MNSPRQYEKLAFVIFALLMFGLACGLGDILFLCVLYGITNVRAQQLHVLDKPNGQPWRVSNGDEIAVNIHPLHFAIVAVLWLLLTLIGFAVLRKFLPPGRRPNVGPAQSRMSANQSTPITRERRTFLLKRRSLRRMATGLFLLWMGWVLVFSLLAQSMGRLALVLSIGFSIAVLAFYIRLRERHFSATIQGTACPGCGQLPMRFEMSGEDKDAHRLLVCERCHIEWDFGRL